MIDFIIDNSQIKNHSIYMYTTNKPVNSDNRNQNIPKFASMLAKDMKNE